MVRARPFRYIMNVAVNRSKQNVSAQKYECPQNGEEKVSSNDGNGVREDGKA